LRNVWWILVFAVLLALGVTMLRRETALEFPAVEHDHQVSDADANGQQLVPSRPLATTARRSTGWSLSRD